MRVDPNDLASLVKQIEFKHRWHKTGIGKQLIK